MTMIIHYNLCSNQGHFLSSVPYTKLHVQCTMYTVHVHVYCVYFILLLLCYNCIEHACNIYIYESMCFIVQLLSRYNITWCQK